MLNPAKHSALPCEPSYWHPETPCKAEMTITCRFIVFQPNRKQITYLVLSSIRRNMPPEIMCIGDLRFGRRIVGQTSNLKNKRGVSFGSRPRLTLVPSCIHALACAPRVTTSARYLKVGHGLAGDANGMARHLSASFVLRSVPRAIALYRALRRSHIGLILDVIQQIGKRSDHDYFEPIAVFHLLNCR